MTSTPTLETLAKEFASDAEHIRRILDLLEAGLLPHHIARYRRAEAGSLSEGHLRRLVRRHQELEELDRRRASIRRQFEALDDPPAKVLAHLERTTDRFELEDLFLPFRRPEPEVQLAVDRGLGELADRLVAKTAGKRDSDDGAEALDGSAPEGAAPDGSAPEGVAPEAAAPAAAAVAGADGGDATTSDTPTAPTDAGPIVDPAPQEGESSDAATLTEQGAIVAEASAAPSVGEDGSGAAVDAEPEATEPAATEGTEPAATEDTEPAATEDTEPAATEGTEPAATEDTEPAATEAASTDGSPTNSSPVDRGHAPEAAPLTPELARLCSEFTRPDRGVHTDEEALAGAMRILADRLGRDAQVRGQVRKILRKHGVLSVRAGSNAQRVGRHKALLKISQPMRQLQGHRLLAIRQAQRERAVTTVVEFDQDRALPKVRAALGRHTDPAFDGVLDAVAHNALDRRLLPMLEADVRLELKERGDEEALRFIGQHLRQILLTPPLTPRPVAGLHVGAKQEWTIAVLTDRGEVDGEPIKLETAGVEELELAETLGAAMRERNVRWIAVGNGREARASVVLLRRLIAAMGADAIVAVVNEAGLTGYVNGELCRQELDGLPMQTRHGVAVGRRLLDPLGEFLKIDPRHLGLGFEQGLVSKANLRRVLDETVESCVALVGCDANKAPRHVLVHVPGLDEAAVGRLIAARTEQPFASREDLRERSGLDEAQWLNAAGSLRVLSSAEPLDHTSIHPEQYPLAHKIVEATGQPADQVFGRPGGLKGLRRADFDVDEYTWRDLTREIAHPGRDARPRLFPVKLLAPDFDPANLEKGQVVEGFVTNVANFGVFVDLGLEREGLVHISEITGRYVRDARELLSIGQAVRARVTEVGGPRIGLSLKDVPDRERPPRAGQRGAGRREGGRDGRRGGPRGDGPREAWPKPDRLTRVARDRRDGMPGLGDDRGRGGRGGSGGGRGGPRGGGRDRGRRDDREGGRHEVAAFLPKRGEEAKGHNPFARFFDSPASGEDKQPDKE